MKLSMARQMRVEMIDASRRHCVMPQRLHCQKSSGGRCGGICGGEIQLCNKMFVSKPVQGFLK